MECITTKDKKIKGSEPTDREKQFADNVQKQVYDVVKEYEGYNRGVKSDKEATKNPDSKDPKRREGIRTGVLKHEENGNTDGCLCEIGYIDDKDFEAKLKDDKFLDKIAEAMKQAILDSIIP